MTRLNRARLVVSLLLAALPAQAVVWPSIAERVARDLHSEDPQQRREAAKNLERLAPAQVQALLGEALADSDVEVRLLGAQASRRVGARQSNALVLPWLTDTDARLRRAACAVLEVSPDLASMGPLARALGDSDTAVRSAAARALGASGLDQAVAPLVSRVDDPDPEVRIAVARGLARIANPVAVVPLIGKAGDSVKEVRLAVIAALGSLRDPRAGSALMLALRDPQVAVRVASLQAIAQMKIDSAVPSLAPLLDTSSPAEVREATLWALAAVGSPSANDVLVKALQKDDAEDESSTVRRALISEGPKVAAAMIPVLAGDAPPAAAAGAAWVLASVAPRGALEVLVGAHRRGSLLPRHAMRALAVLGDPNGLPLVLPLLRADDVSTARTAIASSWVLLSKGSGDGRAVEPLLAALDDARFDRSERAQLLRALGKTRARRVVATLAGYLAGSSLALRRAAIEALGDLGETACDAVLLPLLSHADASLRAQAAQALGRCASAEAVEGLFERLTTSPEDDRVALATAVSIALQRAALPRIVARLEPVLGLVDSRSEELLIEGLGRNGSPEATALLTKLVASSRPSLRRKVAEALGAHPAARPSLAELLVDSDAPTRANALWSLGADADASRAVHDRVRALLSDSEPAVAANAAAALGRSRTASRDKHVLCALERDPRPYVRANALRALRDGPSCPQFEERTLLERDTSSVVREAAAQLLAARVSRRSSVVEGGSAPGSMSSNESLVLSLERRALRRCAQEDPSSAVARACETPSAVGESASQRPSPRWETIFVWGEDGKEPLPESPFSLQEADGFIRSGWTDRRGGVADREGGTLLVPAPLAP